MNSFFSLFILLLLPLNLAWCSERMVGSMFSSQSVEKWNIVADSDDTVSIKDEAGILAIQYDVKIDRERLQGHVTVREGTFRLLLKEPVKLSSAVAVIRFESTDIAGSLRGLKDVKLCPLVRDEKGETFCFFPKATNHLFSGGTGWSQWQSGDFFSGEAGGASIGIYQAVGGDSNSWPDGELTFLGFEAQIRHDSATSKQGRFLLGDITFLAPTDRRDNDFFFADSVLTESGNYRMQIQVRGEFQGSIVMEQQQQVQFHQDRPDSRRQHLSIPVLPAGIYWIECLLTDLKSGEVVKKFDLRHEVAGSAPGEKLSALSSDRVPLIGSFMLNAGDKGVFGPEENFVANLRVYFKSRKDLTIGWKLMTYRYDAVLAEGRRLYPCQDRAFADDRIELKKAAGRTAYRLVVEAGEAGKVVDRQEFFLGVRNAPVQPYARSGVLVDRREIKESSYHRSTYLTPGKYCQQPELSSDDEAVAHFRSYLAQAGKLADGVTYMINLRDFEVLPDVFDFSLLDRILDAAADTGKGLTIRFSQSGRDACRWPKYHKQLNYDGDFIDHSYYGAYSVTDPVNVNLWRNAFAAIHQRYAKHPAFHGYYLMEPGGEWTVVDKPWSADVAGYSAPAVASFRDYLRGIIGSDIKVLNQRWRTRYGSWSEITAPLPDFRKGAAPDLRRQWLDFCKFKRWMDNDFWFPGIVNNIRGYSPNHLIIAYTILINDVDWLKPMYGKLDYLHNGGNLFNLRTGALIDAWREGNIGWISEPHFPHHWAKGDPFVLDKTVWTMLGQAEGGGGNLHIYYFPSSLDLTMHYGKDYCYDRFEKYKPILNELHALKLNFPKALVAMMSDPYTLFCKHRTTFEARQADLERWFDTLDDSEIPAERFQEKNAADYRLLLPNIIDEVMSKENHDRIVTLVEKGATVVLAANTGKYIPEISEFPFQLLKSLGIQPPAGRYIQSQQNVTAAVVAENGVLPVGDAVRFFSLADLQDDLQSKEVREHFFSYPYRWIPQTDYFGYYSDHADSGGKVIARFPNGNPALTTHTCGMGKVLVFWGTPDLRQGRASALMKSIAQWAGIPQQDKDTAIPLTLEGMNPKLGTYYALLWQPMNGAYDKKLRSIPDGTWFAEELVGDRKLGSYSALTIRNQGIPLEFRKDGSPLQIIRFTSLKVMKGVSWTKEFASTIPDTPEK